MRATHGLLRGLSQNQKKSHGGDHPQLFKPLKTQGCCAGYVQNNGTSTVLTTVLTTRGVGQGPVAGPFKCPTLCGPGEVFRDVRVYVKQRRTWHLATDIYIYIYTCVCVCLFCGCFLLALPWKGCRPPDPPPYSGGLPPRRPPLQGKLPPPSLPSPTAKNQYQKYLPKASYQGVLRERPT